VKLVILALSVISAIFVTLVLSVISAICVTLVLSVISVTHDICDTCEICDSCVICDICVTCDICEIIGSYVEWLSHIGISRLCIISLIYNSLIELQS
jgi:hypothetical protein